MLMVLVLDLYVLSDVFEDVEIFGDMLVIKVGYVDGDVCDCCWMVKIDVGSDEVYLMLCVWCVVIVCENYFELVIIGLEV